MFLLGEATIVPSDLIAPVVPVSPNQTDHAVMQIARRFAAAGDRDVSLRLLCDVSVVPVAWFALLAAMSSPLLRILGVDGFIVDLCGETSAGKTTTLMLAASLWGNPDIVDPDSVIISWDLTRVYGERLASIIYSLPVFLDDSRRAPKPEVITQMCYDLTSGRGKGRGNPTSIDVQRSWNLVGISTGEQSLTSFADQPGMRARIITLRGYPFPDRNEEWRKRIEQWVTTAKENYGHLGRAIVQFIVNSRSHWSEWKQRYDQIKAEFSNSIATNPVAGRHLSYLAVITLTAELVCDLFGLPADRRQPVAGIRQLLEQEYGDADRPREAMEKLLDYIYTHPQLIVSGRSIGRDPNPPEAKPTTHIGMWFGARNASPGQFSLAILAHEFDALMTRFGLSRDEILTAWKSRGWLHLGEGGRPLRKIRFKHLPLSGSVRAVCITAQAIALVRPRMSDESAAM